MVTLEASGLGLKFHPHWIFRSLDLSLNEGESLLLRGSNGAGKSSLLRIIAGQLSPTEGTCEIKRQGKPIDRNQLYQEISWTSPTLDLYPEFTLEEIVQFHFQFRKCLASSVPVMLEALQLSSQKKKELRHFSSGMLSRIKAGLAIFSDSSLLLLDEPTANMDAENAALFFELLREYQNGRMLIFASNTPGEFNRFHREMELKPYR